MAKVTATEFARNFRAMLDRVEFRREELIVVRNNHPVAKISPGPVQMTAMEAMTDLYRTLSMEAGEDWLTDSRKSRNIFNDEIRNPWAS